MPAVKKGKAKPPANGAKNPPMVVFPGGDEDAGDRKGGGVTAPKAPKKAGKRR